MSGRRLFVSSLLVLGGFLIFCNSTRAQSILGTVLGTVRDKSGAVIPGAKVVITDTDQGASWTVTTNSRGNYTLVDVKAGHYSVTVSKTGFKTTVVSKLILVARQTLRVDATLPLGKFTQSVIVNGATAGVITTSTATVSSTFNSLDIADLPTNYRASAGGNSPYYLLGVLPGVTADQSGDFSAAGALPSQSQYTLDGISTTNYGGNSPLTSAFPSANAISEMQVQSVGVPAEYGPVVQVTTTSKSGTNALHGQLYDYDQNTSFNAHPMGSVGVPKVIANDFGGSAGGPVYLPHIYNGKDKTFWYFDFELFRSPRAGVIEDTVPTQAMRTGDLSEECTTGFNVAGLCNTASEQLHNWNGQPFPDNQIPAGMITPQSMKFLSLYPLPNVAKTFTVDNYTNTLPANLDSSTYDIRGDEYLTSKLSVWGRFSYENINQLSPEAVLIPSEVDYTHNRLLTLAATYTIKPTLLNEFHAGLTNQPTGQSDPYNGIPFTKSLGLVGQNTNLWWDGIPEIDFTGLTTSETVDRMNEVSESRAWEFLDSLTWIKGGHAFKFGGQAVLTRDIAALGFLGANNYGTYEFNGEFSGNDFGDFLLGYPYLSEQDNVTADNNGLSTEWALYAQDSWRVTHRLTLDYGLRFEYAPGYWDTGGNIGNFDEHVLNSGEAIYPNSFANILAPSFLESFDACPTPALSYTLSDPTSINGGKCTPVDDATQAGLPQSLRATSKNFMPRFGFAYMPFHNDNTVVRGSVGAYDALSLGSIFYALTGTLQSYTDIYTNTLTPTGPAFAWPNIESAATLAGAPSYGTAYFGTADEVNWKQPYSVQWGLSVEHNMGLGTGLSLSYIGMKTTQLVWSPNWNQSLPSTIPYTSQPLSSRPFPNWGVVNTNEPGATAYYNALELDVHHRIGGLTLDSNYMYQRNLSDNLGATTNGGFCGEDECGGRSVDLYDRELQYGNTFEPEHHWQTSVIYQLPFGSGQHFAPSNRVLNAIVSGWQTSDIFEVQSGPWLTPYASGIDPSGTGIGITGGRDILPDKVGPAYPSTQTPGEWFASSGFACPGETEALTSCLVGTSAANPPIGRFGDASVGSLEGPGTIDWDAALAKSIKLGERFNLTIGASFVNVLNHLNLGIPDMNVANPNNPATGECGYGCITSAQGLYTFAGAREGQIEARIDF
jgi:Carboxypeptidase regulatory-like domain/TonB dependent receptor